MTMRSEGVGALEQAIEDGLLRREDIVEAKPEHLSRQDAAVVRLREWARAELSRRRAIEVADAGARRDRFNPKRILKESR